jgi:hypothetical protein
LAPSTPSQGTLTNLKGMLSTVDILNKVACFAKKKIMFAALKAADIN